MNIITSQLLTDLEVLLSNSVNAIGATEDLAVVFHDDIYYAVQRKSLDIILDAYHDKPSDFHLRGYAYFMFRIKGDTLIMFKNRVPLNFIKTRLGRHRYNVVQGEDEMEVT